MRYFKSDNSVYRSYGQKFSNGTECQAIERYNFDMSNWEGYIHDTDETRRRINELDGIVEISEKEAYLIIKS